MSDMNSNEGDNGVIESESGYVILADARCFYCTGPCVLWLSGTRSRHFL
jgi:hypothetical protein